MFVKEWMFFCKSIKGIQGIYNESPKNNLYIGFSNINVINLSIKVYISQKKK